MEEISSAEKIGINDFFHSQNDDQLIIGLAKLIANNLISPRNIEDAIDIITIHSTSVYNILNRKAITKEILFKYLHDRKIPVCSNDNTKVILIEKIKRYWHEKHQQQQQKHTDTNTNNNPSTTIPPYNNNNTNQYENKQIVDHQIDSMAENFPINELSRTFSKWFFTKFNEDQLNAEDFYVDVICEIKLNNNNNEMHEQQTERNQFVLELLHQLKSQFNYYFNPNFCHNGIQGRMNEHGLVMVLSCGTLHNINLQFYCGNFECVFGLIRDPFSDNNWKIKYIKLYLQHKSMQSETSSSVHHPSQCDDQSQLPQLMDCETLKEFLLLPSTSQNI